MKLRLALSAVLCTCLFVISACGSESSTKAPKITKPGKNAASNQQENHEENEAAIREATGMTSDGRQIFPRKENAAFAFGLMREQQDAGEFRFKVGLIDEKYLAIDWRASGTYLGTGLSYKEVFVVMLQREGERIAYLYQPYQTLEREDDVIDTEHREWAAGVHPEALRPTVQRGHFVTLFPGEVASTPVEHVGKEAKGMLAVKLPPGEGEINFAFYVLPKTRGGLAGGAPNTSGGESDAFMLNLDAMPRLTGLSFDDLRAQTLKRMKTMESAFNSLVLSKDAREALDQLDNMSEEEAEQFREQTRSMVIETCQEMIEVHAGEYYAKETLLRLRDYPFGTRDDVSAMLELAPFAIQSLMGISASFIDDERWEDWLEVAVGVTQWCEQTRADDDTQLAGVLAYFSGITIRNENRLNLSLMERYVKEVQPIADTIDPDVVKNFYAIKLMAALLVDDENAQAERVEAAYATIPESIRNYCVAVAILNVQSSLPSATNAAFQHLLPLAQGEEAGQLTARAAEYAKQKAWGDDDKAYPEGLQEAERVIALLAPHVSALESKRQANWVVESAEIKLLNTPEDQLKARANKIIGEVIASNQTVQNAFQAEERERQIALQKRLEEHPGAKAELPKVDPPMNALDSVEALVTKARDRAARPYFSSRSESYELSMSQALYAACLEHGMPRAASLVATTEGRLQLQDMAYTASLDWLLKARERYAESTVGGNRRLADNIEVMLCQAWVFDGRDGVRESVLESIKSASSIEQRRFLDEFIGSLSVSVRSGYAWDALHAGKLASFEAAASRMGALFLAAELEHLNADLLLRASDAWLQLGEMERSKLALKQVEEVSLPKLSEDQRKHLRVIFFVARIKAFYLARENKFSEAAAMLSNLAESDKVPSSVQKELRARAETYNELAEDWVQDLELAKQAGSNQPRVRITFDQGVVEATLFEDAAPNAVASFLKLIEDQWYEGSVVHVVEPHGRVLFGLYQEDFNRIAIPDFTIEAEPLRKAFRGRLMMERRRPTENHSLNVEVAVVLDNGSLARNRNRDIYTVFGEISKGMDVVDRLSRDSRIQKVEILSKRDHEYIPNRIR